MQGKTQIVGRDFERQAYEFLKKRFDKVTWLSHDISSSSSIDFKCFKDNGEYLIEAKYRGNKNKKVSLQYNQQECDFIITNEDDKIILIPKKDFDKKVYIKHERNVIRVDPELIEVLSKNKRNGESYEKCIYRLCWESGWILPEHKMGAILGEEVMGRGKILNEKQFKAMLEYEKRFDKEGSFVFWKCMYDNVGKYEKQVKYIKKRYADFL